MKVWKFTKLDLRMSRSSFKILLIMIAVAAFVLYTKDNSSFVLSYISFGVLIISSNPFIQENISQSGFLNLLPASSSSRVWGRYSYFLLLLTVCQAISFGLLFALRRELFNMSFLAVSCISLSFCILTGSLQYLIFYMLGQIKSQQALALIRLIPALLFFFLNNLLTADNLNGALSFLSHNMLLTSLTVLGGAILLFFFSVCVSCVIYRRKDAG